MEKKMLVALLKKNIHELDMLTEGFQEMEVFPKALIHLATLKTEDILAYLQQLANENEQQHCGAASEVTPVTVSQEVKIEQVAETIEQCVPVTDESIEIIADCDVAAEKDDNKTEMETLSEHTLSAEQTQSAELDEIAQDSADGVELSSQLSPIVEPEPPVDTSSSHFIPLAEPEIIQQQTSSLTDAEVLVEEPVVHPGVTTRNEGLLKPDMSLGEALANKKVADIKQAMSLGDRFRFQRELFKGNGEDMNKTIAYINLLASFEEVESFLQSKYKWNPEDAVVEDFYRIIHRKF